MTEAVIARFAVYRVFRTIRHSADSDTRENLTSSKLLAIEQATDDPPLSEQFFTKRETRGRFVPPDFTLLTIRIQSVRAQVISRVTHPRSRLD